MGRADAPSPPRFLQLAGHPLRWQLLSELARSDRRVGELCELAGQPQSLVSYHLGQLRDGELVSARRSSADGRDTYYALDLARCGELLGAAGARCIRGWRRRRAHTEAAARRARAGAVPVHRQQRALADGRGAGRAPLRAARSRRPAPAAIRSRCIPTPCGSMRERGIDIAGRRSKHLERVRRRALRPRDHPLRPRARGLPRVPRHAADASTGASPTPRARRRRGQLPAFERTAAELETRIGFLLDTIQATTDSEEVSEHA